ncbi:MAG TPA: hypothetical protein VGK61_00890, partial [Planctomycetota bacterium]
MARTGRWKWWALAALFHAAILFGATKALLREREAPTEDPIAVAIRAPACEVKADRIDDVFERRETPKDRGVCIPDPVLRSSDS